MKLFYDKKKDKITQKMKLYNDNNKDKMTE